MSVHPFQLFLEEFVPALARKAKQLNQASWLLETTGAEDAASLKADLDAECRFLFQDAAQYQKLLSWQRSGEVRDPLLQRQLLLLIHAFKQNQVPKAMLEEMAQREAQLSQSYASFRAVLEGREVSENDLREILKTETNVARRKEAWEASKKIGAVLAPQILDLVRLRNQVASQLGYSDYFQMQLELQEVDAKWLLAILNDLGRQSDAAYSHALQEINHSLARQFHVDEKDIGAWAWGDPFCQEDPVHASALDRLVAGVNFSTSSAAFYQRLGFDVAPILQRSDMEERPGKSQHAFCTHIDRNGDIRTLNNVKPSLKWLETVLHELGHAIYETGFDPSLPWLLREPPHMITTEAMALLAGRQAYRQDSLRFLAPSLPPGEPLLRIVEESLRRRQLIFSRWVLVMTAFESELYRDPSQDLNALWWSLVAKHQKIAPPSDRQGRFDWACKYHIGLAPVYYFSYLLGEMFASSIQEAIARRSSGALSTRAAGEFLREKLFAPGNRLSWDRLVEHVTGAPLSPAAWLREFAPVL